MVDNIISGGFNRSYAGKNATFYGPGCYFARDATYSARNTYSPPDVKGMKRIFLCKIALGAHVKVDYGYDGELRRLAVPLTPPCPPNQTRVHSVHTYRQGAPRT